VKIHADPCKSSESLLRWSHVGRREWGAVEHGRYRGKPFEELARLVAEDLAALLSKTHIVANLVTAGWDRKPAIEFVEGVNSGLQASMKRRHHEAVLTNLLIGLIVLCVGVASYLYAALSGGGGYLFAWEVMAFGLNAYRIWKTRRSLD
jgi:hypothetical protein